jgi:D-alanine-D-alanine ligase
MSSRTNPRIVVLLGGPSAEREVSLSSGRECAAALRQAGCEVVELDAGPDLATRLQDDRPDVVFNALHGRWGEDGCVQGTKAAYRGAGLPCLDSLLAPRDEVRARHVMAPPYVVKPNNEGSSVGVYIVREAANSPPQLADDMPDTVMVEAYAPGRELTTAVMGDRALTVTDIVTEGWYDYHAKYAPGGSRHVCPAQVPADIFAACLDYALAAHQALGCRGLSRTDFRWDEARGLAGLVLLETNTQPGMTPTSLAPEQAAACGIAFPDLCRWLVEDASCGR